MKKWRILLKSAYWTLLGLCSIGIMGFIIVYVYAEIRLPDVEKLKDAHLQVPLRVYSEDGLLITQFGTRRRIPVRLDQIPKPLIDAVLATEDARFYQHSGVDILGIMRAAVAVLSSGKKVQGASTITMQVARNFYLSREKTYIRKIKEILLALKIDREISKDKILELYLNKIYFGYRAYGVAAAAKTYYGKSLDELSLAQMAMLAGLPQAPSRSNPINRKDLALKRRNHVLSRMKLLDLISEQQYNAAIREPDEASFHHARIQLSAPYVAEMVRQQMVDQYGESAYEKGLSVYTTIDSKWQTASDNALRWGLLRFDKRHGFRKPGQNLADKPLEKWLEALTKEKVVADLIPAAVMSVSENSVEVLFSNGKSATIPWQGLSWARPETDSGQAGASPERAIDIVRVGDVVRVTKTRPNQWRLAQLPEVQGAVLALDPDTGEIKALTGGFDYQLTTFNRAVQAERQTGSNFKPFIYSAALNKGLTLATMVNDAPIVEQATGENKLWRPNNDNLTFYGPIPLRIGLIKSRNLISIRLLQQIGIPYALDYLQRFGFTADQLPRGLSLALGSGLSTPLQIADAYAVFANGGYLVKPCFIKKIVDQNGDVIFSEKFEKPPRVITEQNAYLMTQVLQDVIQRGTGRGAKVLKRHDLAGKTGTTNDQTDAWFSGFNQHVVATVWVGFDDMHSLHEYAARAALPIWIKFMGKILQGSEEASMPEPPGITRVRIDPKTGLLALPSQRDAHFEIFRQEYAPRQYSRVSSVSDEGSFSADKVEDSSIF